MLKKVILLTSNEEWGDMWYSKQHYANELAKLGHEVYFLNPSQPWTFHSLFSLGIKIHKIKENLFTVNYKNNLPTLGGRFRRINDWLNSWKLFKCFGQKENLLFWFFDPFRFVNISFFRKFSKIFHVVDDYSNHTIDLKMASSADMLIYTSPVSLRRYEHPNMLHVPHGIAEDDLVVEPEKVAEIRKRWHRFILYIGGINQHLNFPMLKRLAKELPQHQLIFLGKIQPPDNANDQELMDHFFAEKNVEFAGLVDAKELKNYIAAAEVCLIPYYPYGKSRAQTLKAINYITQLKPIVAIELEDLKQFRNKSVFMTESEDQFIAYVKDLTKGLLPVDQTEADHYRESIRYPRLINKIFHQLYGARMFNDRKLTEV